MTRREALGLLVGAAAAFPLVGAMPGGVARATDDGTGPAFTWEPIERNPVVLSRGSTSAYVRMFPTLLPMGYLVPDAIDAWYLWAWHHHSHPKIRLWTAPSPEGPFTEQPPFVGPPAPGLPPNYDATHFSSGDIVWDAARSRLVASPHSLRLDPHSNGEPCQDSFLLESRDGVDWRFLDGDNSPRLVCGPPRSFDSVHTGYGRLLRDLDGHLATYQGRYWWLYRAQRHDAGQGAPTYFVPALASAESLAGPWTKHGKAYDMAQQSTALFGLGSFVRAGARHHVYYAEGSAALAPTVQYLNGSEGDDMVWNGPGVPVPIPNSGETGVTAGGGNLVRDPWTGVQYLVQDGTLPMGGSEIRIYRSVAS
jgi:hypothetical protein